MRPPDPAALYRMHSTLSGPYRVRNIAVDNKAVVTNQVPSGLNRGFGGPQFYFPARTDDGQAAAQIWNRSAPKLRLRNVVRERRISLRHGPLARALKAAITANALRRPSRGRAIRNCSREREQARARGTHVRHRHGAGGRDLRRPTWPTSTSR